MKIAWGTYALPTVPLEQALPRLAALGFDGIELCVGPEHLGSLPSEIDAARRARLRELLIDHSLGLPALMVLGSLYTPDAAQHGAALATLRDAAALARDLAVEGTPVVAMGIGGKSRDWEAVRDELVRQLRDVARLAADEDVVVAGEAHCGAAVDRSERAVWLMEAVGSPHLRLHFDIVHTWLAGERIEDSVAALLPYTAHTHITDARRLPDGKFELRLLGDGELDAAAYVAAMAAGGWPGYLTLEVSRAVWGRPDYEPWRAAEQSLAALRTAFERAGMTPS